MSHRIKKINELIKQELGNVLLTEIALPDDSLVTITGVSTTRDLGQAYITFSALPTDNQNKILSLLKSRAKFLQFQLSKKMALRRVPKLHFSLDDSQANVDHIDKLIDKIKKEG
ncbi:30S ribosome-binding factor RbfA [Patescibacteria group bacterium]|nr:30S ribosome-binding factor RbfA [Patescibacteria group bacterium]